MRFHEIVGCVGILVAWIGAICKPSLGMIVFAFLASLFIQGIVQAINNPTGKF